MNEDCPHCIYNETREKCRGCFEGSNYYPEGMNEELICPSYAEWMDAANTATDRLYECVKNEVDDKVIRLYEVLSIASSLCAVAAAIKERK